MKPVCVNSPWCEEDVCRCNHWEKYGSKKFIFDVTIDGIKVTFVRRFDTVQELLAAKIDAKKDRHSMAWKATFEGKHYGDFIIMGDVLELSESTINDGFNLVRDHAKVTLELLKKQSDEQN